MIDVPFDICDPSYSVNASYWQLGVASRNTELWDEIKKCINKALPQKRVEEFDRTIFHERELEFWGCVKHKKSLWLYRHFLTGRDGAGRPGRYFFVIFKIEGSLDESLGFVSKICRRLADKVSIPLDLSDLKNDGESDSPKISLPDGIREKLESSSADIHIAWVIEKDKGVTEYKDLSVPKPPPPPAPIDTPQNGDTSSGGEDQSPGEYFSNGKLYERPKEAPNLDTNAFVVFIKSFWIKASEFIDKLSDRTRIPKAIIVIALLIVPILFLMLGGGGDENPTKAEPQKLVNESDSKKSKKIKDKEQKSSTSDESITKNVDKTHQEKLCQKCGEVIQEETKKQLCKKCISSNEGKKDQNENHPIDKNPETPNRLH